MDTQRCFPESYVNTLCFSESYAEAREKFLDAANTAAAEVHQLLVLQDEDEAYTIDIAIIRGNAPGLVVVSSGTHGVEGYAGSAIQIHLLEKLKNSPVEQTVLFVHAVNPYGMAHFRRWNENNVDLNRNAILPSQFEKLISDDSCRSTYLKFNDFFNPNHVPGSCYAYVGIWFTSILNILRYGFPALKTALVAATYTESRGVFYGGQELQASHKLLQEFMTKHFSHLRASDVTWMDIHTGLGPCGVDVLLGDEHDAAEMAALFPKILGKCDGFQGGFSRSTDEVLSERCGTAPSTSGSTYTGGDQVAGYQSTVGIFHRHEWLAQFFKPDSGRVTAVCQEFGTLSGIRVARALMLENAGYHYDRKNHAHWRTYTKDAFYVNTPSWKQSVLERGDDVFNILAARADRASKMCCLGSQSASERTNTIKWAWSTQDFEPHFANEASNVGQVLDQSITTQGSCSVALSAQECS